MPPRTLHLHGTREGEEAQGPAPSARRLPEDDSREHPVGTPAFRLGALRCDRKGFGPASLRGGYVVLWGNPGKLLRRYQRTRPGACVDSELTGDYGAMVLVSAPGEM